MDDSKIVDLFWERSEEAILRSDEKYGRYCRGIAQNILGSPEDSEECVNDTWIKAWESIPPNRPSRLSAFLGRITRNLAINRYHSQRAAKRDCPMEIVLDEAAEIIPDTAEGSLSDELALRDAVNSFLDGLPRATRIVFLRRYWYMCGISDIARDMGFSESNVKVMLHRTRKRLKEHLEKRGISI